MRDEGHMSHLKDIMSSRPGTEMPLPRGKHMEVASSDCVNSVTVSRNDAW